MAKTRFLIFSLLLLTSKIYSQSFQDKISLEDYTEDVVLPDNNTDSVSTCSKKGNKKEKNVTIQGLLITESTDSSSGSDSETSSTQTIFMPSISLSNSLNNTSSINNMSTSSESIRNSPKDSSDSIKDSSGNTASAAETTETTETDEISTPHEETISSDSDSASDVQAHNFLICQRLVGYGVFGLAFYGFYKLLTYNPDKSANSDSITDSTNDQDKLDKNINEEENPEYNLSYYFED